MGIIDVIAITIILAIGILVAETTQSIESIFAVVLLGIPGVLLLLSAGGFILLPTRGFWLVLLIPPFLHPCCRARMCLGRFGRPSPGGRMP